MYQDRSMIPVRPIYYTDSPLEATRVWSHDDRQAIYTNGTQYAVGLLEQLEAKHPDCRIVSPEELEQLIAEE